MKIYIDGEELSPTVIADAMQTPRYISTNTLDWRENVLGALHAWHNDTGFGYGEPGNGFYNVSTSGTTGFPQRISHSRETIEEAVEGNIELYNLNKHSKIYSLYSPKGIAWSTLAVHLAVKLDCELYIETYKGLDYINRIHTIRPTHTLILPNLWKQMHKHPKWETLDYSSVDTLIIGSDFTPKGSMEELRTHGANKVYNVYGSSEVPPAWLISEYENEYSSSLLPKGISLKIEDDCIVAKWSTQNEYWHSNDLVEGTLDRFKLKGRKHNMFKQNTERVYPEQIEKSAVEYGADLSLCQQVGVNCILHYTGNMYEDEVKQTWSHIPRFRLKKVDEIKVDDNLKKIIRTQSFK